MHRSILVSMIEVEKDNGIITDILFVAKLLHDLVEKMTPGN